MNGIIRVALYARVSSQRQADEKTIESQCGAIRERIEEDGLTLRSDMVFCDEGYSGSELLRPDLEKLRDRIAAGLVDVVYVHTPDRLARRYAHQALLLEEFGKHRCKVVFGDHVGLAESPEANLLVQMQGVIAEYEREKILERTRRGRRYSASSGNVSVFGRAPYGYRYLRKSAENHKAKWEIAPLESQHVQLMFQLVGEQGCSLAGVCRELLRRGIKTRNGKAAWHAGTVRDILIQPAYYGQARYGKQRLVPRKPGKRSKRGDPAIPRKAKVTEATDLKDQIVIPVPALVSESLFQQVAKIMEENRKRARERACGPAHLLSGLLICGECGSAYCGHCHRQVEYFYYRCIGAEQRNSGRPLCKNIAVNGTALSEYVWSDVCRLLQDPQRLQTELNRRQSESTSPESNLQDLERRIQQIRNRLDRLIDAYESGLIEKSELESRIGPLREEYDRESAASLSLRGRLNDTDDVAAAEHVLKQLSDQVGESLATASEGLKRDVLKLLVRRIEIHKNEIRLVYKVPQNAHAAISASLNFLPHCLPRQ